MFKNQIINELSYPEKSSFFLFAIWRVGQEASKPYSFELTGNFGTFNIEVKEFFYGQLTDKMLPYLKKEFPNFKDPNPNLQFAQDCFNIERHNCQQIEISEKQFFDLMELTNQPKE